MAFPQDELDPGEEVLLDLNPVFGRLVLPWLELILVTGVTWLLIGVIDGPLIAAGDLGWLRRVLLAAWAGLVAWRAVAPVAAWLGERTVVTDRRVLLRRGWLRPRVVVIDRAAIRAVDRRGADLELRVDPWGPPLALRDVPGARRVARLLAPGRG